jgi:hypothetical protein
LAGFAGTQVVDVEAGYRATWIGSIKEPAQTTSDAGLSIGQPTLCHRLWVDLANCDFTGGEIAVALAVTPVDRGTDPANPIDLHEYAGACDHQTVLRINIGGDVVRDLTGVAADADVSVKGRRTKPDRGTSGPLRQAQFDP